MDGFPFQVEVVRTNRKRLRPILCNGVKVTVPASLSRRIRDLVIKRTPWINRKLILKARASSCSDREFVSGETVAYLGKNYRLKVLQGDCSLIKMLRGYITQRVISEKTGGPFCVFLEHINNLYIIQRLHQTQKGSLRGWPTRRWPVARRWPAAEGWPGAA